MISIEFTSDEMKQLKGATNAWLWEMATVQRTYNIKSTATLSICASVHNKVLEATGESE